MKSKLQVKSERITKSMVFLRVRAGAKENDYRMMQLYGSLPN